VILALDQCNRLKCAGAFAAQQRELIAGLLSSSVKPEKPDYSVKSNKIPDFIYISLDTLLCDN